MDVCFTSGNPPGLIVRLFIFECGAYRYTDKKKMNMFRIFYVNNVENCI